MRLAELQPDIELLQKDLADSWVIPELEVLIQNLIDLNKEIAFILLNLAPSQRSLPTG